MTTSINKAIAMAFVLSLCLGLTACGKSQEASNVDELISAIGTVTINSIDAIQSAENAYNTLTDKQKEEVENYIALDKAKEELVFVYGKTTFDDLNEAVEICIVVMDSGYGAWHYGIFEDEDATVSGLATKTGLTTSELAEAISGYGIESATDQNFFLQIEFNYPVLVVYDVYRVRGTFDDIEELLESAKSKLRTMSDDFSDYEYFPTLKDYYSKAFSYCEFSIEPTGSFNQLADTINDYENSLRTYHTDLDFVFGE